MQMVETRSTSTEILFNTIVNYDLIWFISLTDICFKFSVEIDSYFHHVNFGVVYAYILVCRRHCDKLPVRLPDRQHGTVPQTDETEWDNTRDQTEGQNGQNFDSCHLYYSYSKKKNGTQ